MAVSYRFDENGNELLPETKTVSWVNDYIKQLIEEEMQLKDIYVSGEISNFKLHSSGHIYFTLKDEKSEIKAVMFKTYAIKMRFSPKNGMKVLVHARLGVFERAGTYQLYVDSMQPEGLGSLYLAYEQLKAKLLSEGLFAPEHKKPIPKFPKKIGIITSPTGAAVRDIIKVCKKRCPFVKLVLFPSAVQGENAPFELTRAVEYLTAMDYVDLIIIGRGGGSIEDLWGFNDEGLARAIYNSHIPIISAVGHEIDFTICDFVADARAATPSHAAEMATPDINELVYQIKSLNDRARASLNSKIQRYRQILLGYENSKALKSPETLFDTKKMQLLTIAENVADAMKIKTKDLRSVLLQKSTALNALSPLAVLSRGYGVVLDKNNEVIKGVDSVCTNDEIFIKLSNGTIGAVVNTVEREEN